MKYGYHQPWHKWQKNVWSKNPPSKHKTRLPEEMGNVNLYLTDAQREKVDRLRDILMMKTRPDAILFLIDAIDIEHFYAIEDYRQQKIRELEDMHLRMVNALRSQAKETVTTDFESQLHPAVYQLVKGVEDKFSNILRAKTSSAPTDIKRQFCDVVKMIEDFQRNNPEVN